MKTSQFLRSVIQKAGEIIWALFLLLLLWFDVWFYKMDQQTDHIAGEKDIG